MIQFRTFRVYFFGFFVENLSDFRNIGKLDFSQREHIVFHIAAAGNADWLWFAPFAVFKFIVVDIVRIIRVLDFRNDARTLAAIEMDILENVNRFAAELRQGFQRIFCSLQGSGISQEIA